MENNKSKKMIIGLCLAAILMIVLIAVIVIVLMGSKSSDTKSNSKSSKTTEESKSESSINDSKFEDGDKDNNKQNNDTKYVSVTTDAVKVRSQASTEGEVIGIAKSGDVFQCTGINDQWAQIIFDGKEGYIRTDFLTDATEEDYMADGASEQAEAAGVVYVKTDDMVNVRSQAATDSETIGKAEKGEMFAGVITDDGQWVCIEFEGREGYIKINFITEISKEEFDNKTEE